MQLNNRTRYAPAFLIDTLHMEKYWNWSGILIEPEHEAYQHLLTQKRNAWTLPNCLSRKPYLTKV